MIYIFILISLDKVKNNNIKNVKELIYCFLLFLTYLSSEYMTEKMVHTTWLLTGNRVSRWQQCFDCHPVTGQLVDLSKEYLTLIIDTSTDIMKSKS